MKYPIDLEAFIAGFQADYGPDTTVEEIYRKTIPVINDAYRNGKVMRPGWPQNPEKEIAACEALDGPMDAGIKRYLTAVIGWANAAYAQGQQEAGRTTA